MLNPRISWICQCAQVEKFAELSWVFGAFVEVNGSYFNTNGFNINTVIFSNTMILFMEAIPFAIFQYRPVLVVRR